MKKAIYVTLLLGFVLTLFYACASTTGRTAGELVDDTTIANTIRAKIIEDKELSILKINTDVFNGNVTLLGVVPSKQAEEHLLSVAQGVKGVKSVTSRLTIQMK
jgi:hyperosmotically inducible periplasmic protein